MQQTITPFLQFLLTSFLLMFATNSNAQWIMSPLTLTDLETDVLGTSGLFPAYTNVFVDNHLAVNTNMSTTTTCPSCPGCSATTDYPFVVTVLPVGPNTGDAIVLSDPADKMRRIIGLSQTGAVGMFSGSNIFNGAAIRLMSPACTLGTLPQGAVQTISNGSIGAGARAFEHLNYWGTGIGVKSMFSIDQNGDARITGKLSFDLYPSDISFRQIEGMSPNYGITMYTGSAASGFLGTEMQLTDPGNTTTGTPGLIQFTSIFPSSYSGLSYNFKVGNSVSAASLIPVMQIDNKGHTLVGSITPPSPVDRLTVDGSIYLSTDLGTDISRNIYAKSTYSVFNITSGTFTDGSDGACQTMISPNNNTVTSPGFGSYTPGAFIVRSYGDNGGNVPLAYGFQNNSPTTGMNNIFLINHTGNGIFGPNVALTDINMSVNDIFTINTSLGFWAPADPIQRVIHGNTYAGNLSISSLTDYTNGSNITLYGQSVSVNPGSLQFSCPDTAGLLATFDNYIPVLGLNPNLQIGNNGQTVVGPGMHLSLAVPADILTVENRIGMYSPTHSIVSIAGNSNTTNAWFSIDANTGSSNGGTIEFYGPNATISSTTGWDADRRGMMRYISYADGLPGPNYAHIFYSYASSICHPHMALTNDGRVIIGEDLINAQNYMSTNSYDLYVENGILTEQVRVALRTGSDWTDYVFDKNYELMPLGKVADYVKENKHLPDVPSAEEVKDEGIDVAKMDAKLLQKIEELTLYAIQQQKQIDELQKKIDELTNK